MDSCVHSWLMITALIRAPHLWPTTDACQNMNMFDNKESIVFIFVFFLVYTTVNVYKQVPIWIRGGASLVLRHSVRYTHTVLRSGNKIGWSLNKPIWASARGRLDKAIQWKFMKISWTTSLLFWHYTASVKTRSQMNVCVHWLESCKWTRVIRS